MYQCKFFYAEDKTPKKGENTVIAAWEVIADGNYSFDMTEDELLMKNMYCFVRTVSGSGVLETNEKKVILSGGKYIILPREEIMRYYSNGNLWTYYWVDFLNYSGDFSKIGKIMNIDYTEREKQLFDELLTAGTKYPYETRYINVIFSHYYYFMQIKDHDGSQEQYSPVFSEITSYIGQKLYGKITVQEIADFFGVSTRRIHQIFRENSGMSPKQYISHMKISKAKELLDRTSSTVADIAAILGYDSAYHFSAAFKKAQGISPRAYRNNESKVSN